MGYIFSCRRFRIHSRFAKSLTCDKELRSKKSLFHCFEKKPKLGLSLQASGDIPRMMPAVIFMSAILVQLLIFYWFSNEIIAESLSVSSGIFESKWTTTDAKTRKELALLQLSTSKRLVFRAGPCNEMSLNTFLVILKTSYSFFTLLKETK